MDLTNVRSERNEMFLSIFTVFYSKALFTDNDGLMAEWAAPAGHQLWADL